MKDAELMTQEATVPGLEVKNGVVILNERTIGWVRVTNFDYEATIPWSKKRVSRPTRNDAVKWILDQHKEAQS